MLGCSKQDQTTDPGTEIETSEGSSCDDWAEFRTQLVMKEVDEEIKELHECWDTQEAEDFYPGFQQIYFSQDNRNEPLGGQMGYSYELFEDKSENFDDEPEGGETAYSYRASEDKSENFDD